jgi:hypothetical protein
MKRFIIRNIISAINLTKSFISSQKSACGPEYQDQFYQPADGGAQRDALKCLCTWIDYFQICFLSDRLKIQYLSLLKERSDELELS